MSRYVKRIVETLEGASKFESIFTSQQVLELLYIARAQDESSEEEAERALKALIIERPDDKVVVNDIVEALESFKWSARVTALCFKMLKMLALTSDSNKDELLKIACVQKLKSFASTFRDNSSVQAESRVVLSLFNAS
jgi:hypothetical protein